LRVPRNDVGVGSFKSRSLGEDKVRGVRDHRCLQPHRIPSLFWIKA
jgi:hypothetical protein